MTTNLGEYVAAKTNDNLRSSKVEVYSRDQIWQLTHTNLGMVDAEYCQNERFGHLPSETELKKIMRSKAQQLGGNGIVYDACDSGRDYLDCKQYIRCQATAYDVEYDGQDI